MGGGATYILMRRDESSPSSDPTMEILRERYAREEITKTEYDKRQAQFEDRNNSSE